MARIFISHSSHDNPAAVEVAAWLESNGWDDYFLDLDPERGLIAGQRWQEALRQASTRCEAVIFLISPAWLKSKWCLAEFLLAKQEAKRIFGVVISPVALDEIPVEMASEWQLVHLSGDGDSVGVSTAASSSIDSNGVSFSKVGLQQLELGLKAAGITADTFSWPPERDPDRAPYRGLRVFSEEDAGIFFGRDAQILRAVELLRRLRTQREASMLAILGASGAGKSSFMRAGLLPRLVRDDRNFLTLGTLMPDRDPCILQESFVDTLMVGASRVGAKVTRAHVRQAFSEGFEATCEFLGSLADASHRRQVGQARAPKRPTIILPIDQAETLFSQGTKGLGVFNTFLGDLLLSDLNVVAVATIRSDRFESLQNQIHLRHVVKTPYDLPQLAKGSFEAVITGPAERMPADRPLELEPALVEQILRDVEAGGGASSLPLLGFTLARIYTEHGLGGQLAHAHYVQLGGLEGAIEAAINTAVDRAVSTGIVEGDRSSCLDALRNVMIPHLAAVDPATGLAERRTARLDSFAPTVRPLVDLLIDQRLLTVSTRGVDGETVIEIAHDSMLILWGDLTQWLAEDERMLKVLQSVTRASAEWIASSRNDDLLVHRYGRMEDARALLMRDDFAATLDPDSRAYIAACEAFAEAEIQKRIDDEIQVRVRTEQRWRRYRSLVAVAFILLLLLVNLATPPRMIEWREQAFDLFQRFAPAKYDDPVVIVAIDEESLARFGQWPWPRTFMAEILRNLSEAGAATVAFNLVFPRDDRNSFANLRKNWSILADRFYGPDQQRKILEAFIKLEQLPDNDVTFAQEIEFTPTVLGISPAEFTEDQPFFKGGIAFTGQDPRGAMISYPGAITNIKMLEEAAAGVGSLAFGEETASSTVRKAPMIVNLGGQIIPSLGAQAFLVAQGAHAPIVKATKDGTVEALEVGALIIPLEEDGAMRIRFSAADRRTIVSASDLLVANVSSEVRDLISGKIVFIGATAVGLDDVVETPLSEAVPGVYVQADIAGTVFNQVIPTRPGWVIWFERGLGLFLGIAIALLSRRLGTGAIVSIAVTAIVPIAWATAEIFRSSLLLIDPVLPLLCLSIPAVTCIFASALLTLAPKKHGGF